MDTATLSSRAAAVRATVNYIARQEEPLYNYYSMEPPPGKPASNEVREPHEVEITNMRTVAKKPTLDANGFELIPFKTAVKDIYDTAERNAVFNPEVIALIKARTGAAEVRLFQPFLRGPEALRRLPGTITAPAGTAHVDFTYDTGPMFFETYLGKEAEKFRGRRFAIINVWRPITGPLRDHPLTVCDVRTLSPEDLMPSKAFSLVDENGLNGDHGELQEAEVFSVAYNPSHRWYYVPDMMPDEALLLKNYDSDESGVSRFSPHVAFRDPAAPHDVLPRASIEIRALTIW